MTYVLATHFPPWSINATCATYLRWHDDIGWAVTEEDVAAVGLSGLAHCANRAAFYVGAFLGAFACNAPFETNAATGDVRV